MKLFVDCQLVDVNNCTAGKKKQFLNVAFWNPSSYKSTEGLHITLLRDGLVN